ncbi:uncharacterized protein JCM6883_004361 [Sporobolomyces salmoneus]|uniref:uncharacterized protein n=1 Tax=Sporobolomyces salmoneus TaxID=183962 RepID=UPI0031726002
MEEDSPWGAPSRSYSPPPALPPSTTLDHSPPLSSSTAAPSWGIDDGGGWGNSSTVEEEYPRFERAAEEEEKEESGFESPGEVYRKESVGDAWGSNTDELPTSSGTKAAEEEREFELPPPVDDSTPLPAPSATLDEDPTTLRIEHSETVEVEEESDDRGWTPSTPPLPPISTLQISSSSSPSSPTANPTTSSWEPSSFDEAHDVPPPLPSVDDLFGKRERESIGDGEEAWGSSRGWEERQRSSPPQQFEEEHVEEEDDVTEEERREIERKVREAEEAAQRGEDNWGTTTSVSTPTVTVRVSGEEVEERGHKGDVYDLDAPEKRETKKKSWWSRGESTQTQKQKEVVEEEDPQTVGVPEVQTGDSSGKTVKEEESTQQVGTIGRLFGRFRKPTPNASDATGGGGGSSTRTSTEQQPPTPTIGSTPKMEENWKNEDFDALSSGQFGVRSSTQQHQFNTHEEEEEEVARGGFFGSERGSLKKIRARIPTAPPEDDFGGLLGAFETAPPVRPQSTTTRTRTTSSKPFDPFDPLSEPPPPTIVSPPATTNSKRPVSYFVAPPPRPVTSQKSGDDSFDAFFDSVTSSIPKPSLSSIPTPRLPSTSTRPSPSLILPKPASSKRTSLASPIPRMASTSPDPVRSPASSTVSSRASTPILPLAPPPPPSQPLAQRNNLLLGSLAPNLTTSRPNSISPPPSSNPLSLSTGSIPSRVASPPVRPTPPTGNTSGPLSRDDLDFFENL